MKIKSEKVVKEIRHKTRRKYSSEEKTRIILEGLRGEDRIAEVLHLGVQCLQDIEIVRLDMQS